MKQEERSRRTTEKILQAAVEEFGSKGYDGASLDTICSEYQISKGLLYHNFENKDALYLACTRLCYQEITGFLEQGQYTAPSYQENIRTLLSLRKEFFADHPGYSRLFFSTLFQPPGHLEAEIRAIKAPFDTFNTRQFRNVLRQLPLREEITEDQALDYFTLFQEMFHRQYARRAETQPDYTGLIRDHELQLTTLLDLMLYGIAKEEPHHAPAIH